MYELICDKKDSVLIFKFYTESDRLEFLKRRTKDLVLKEKSKNKYVFIDSKTNETITYKIRWLTWKK